MPWEPTTYVRFERAHETSTGVARILTDAGPAFIKPLGNRESPHVLASGWVTTKLAAQCNSCWGLRVVASLRFL